MLHLGEETQSLANTLHRFIQKHFGCELVVHIDPNHLPVDLHDQPDDLILPILGENGLKAYVQIKQGRQQSSEIQNKIRSIVDMVFAEIVTMQTDLNSVEHLERAYQRLNPNQNVVKFPSFATPPSHKPQQQQSSSSDRLLKINSMLICHTELDQFHPTAVDLHNVSGRSALIRFEDIDPSTFVSVDKIENLGPVTIVIRDIDEIAPHHLKTLLNFLDKEPSQTKPILLMGLLAKISDVHKHGFQWSDQFHQLVNHENVWLMECRNNIKSIPNLLKLTNKASEVSH